MANFNKRNKQKVIKSLFTPPNKRSKSEKNAQKIKNLRLLIDFSLIDKDHNLWGFSPSNKKYCEYCTEIISFMSFYCTMTANEILKASGGKKEGNGNNNHYCKVTDFCREAIKRLEELKMDDCERLFSLRFAGIKRIYGNLEGNIFQPIWFDCYHETKKGIYPKKA